MYQIDDWSDNYLGKTKKKHIPLFYALTNTTLYNLF